MWNLSGLIPKPLSHGHFVRRGKKCLKPLLFKFTMRYVCDFFYETMDLVGPTKECIGENQQPLGGLVADKKVRPHVPQKEKPTKKGTF